MSRERREIAYSIVVIILIPTLLAVNTLVILRSTRNAFNIELMRKADLANSIIAEATRDSIGTDAASTQISDLISNLQSERSDLTQIRVLIPGSNDFSVLAQSKDSPKELDAKSKLQLQIAATRNTPIATRIAALTPDNKPTQAWSVITPITDADKKVVALVSTNVLTTDSDELIDKAALNSMFVVLASIVLVVILLARHFRFVSYVELLRRQKEVNQTMSDFLSVASHELKAPMSIIKGYISNTIDGTFGEIPPKAIEQLQVSIAQTDRLNNLVQDLLSVSRIDQGHINFDMKAFDVNEVIEPILTDYQRKAADKGLELHYEKHPGIYIYADIGRYQEIITNLVDNAVKYTAQGAVTISVHEDKKMILTSVKDTGHGMSSDERSRLFQRFYRVKNEHTKDIGGTGLGLWIIKQYAEKMGGAIEVDSIVGTGTEFSVSLKKTEQPKPEPLASV